MYGYICIILVMIIIALVYILISTKPKPEKYTGHTEISNINLVADSPEKEQVESRNTNTYMQLDQDVNKEYKEPITGTTQVTINRSRNKSVMRYKVEAI